MNLFQQNKAKKFGGEGRRGKKIQSGMIVSEEILQEEK